MMFGRDDDMDRWRFAQLYHNINDLRDHLRLESDTIRSFHTQVLTPVLLAFEHQNDHEIIFSGEERPADANRATHPRVDGIVKLVQKDIEKTLVICEFKKHGIIVGDAWRSTEPFGSSVLLSQEIRGQV